MKRILALFLVPAIVVGCKSYTVSPYVSPRVTGRVLAADTRQPLAGVQVINRRQSDGTISTQAPKGGQILNTPPAEQTEADGHFLLVSERVLAPFSSSSWMSLQLLFQRSGYERFITNISRLNLRTNTWHGQPALDMGDVLLQPEPR
jgi:hypothetical protein